MSSQKTRELTTGQSVEETLAELKTQYYNDEIGDDEYGDRVEVILIEAEEKNLDYQHIVEPEEPDIEVESEESTKNLWQYWPYGLMALLLFSIPLTRGRTLIFLIPLLLLWFVKYAIEELNESR